MNQDEVGGKKGTNPILFKFQFPACYSPNTNVFRRHNFYFTSVQFLLDYRPLQNKIQQI